jgi:hypothetical protein
MCCVRRTQIVITHAHLIPGLCFRHFAVLTHPSLRRLHSFVDPWCSGESARVASSSHISIKAAMRTSVIRAIHTTISSAWWVLLLHHTTALLLGRSIFSLHVSSIEVGALSSHMHHAQDRSLGLLDPIGHIVTFLSVAFALFTVSLSHEVFSIGFFHVRTLH